MKPSDTYPARRRPWHPASLIVATLILTFLCSAEATAQGAGYWHTAGNQILDSSGQVVRIAGVNWYGFETTDEIIHGLWAQDYHTILNEIKSNGYNTIRMPFSNQMVETPEVPTNFTQTVNGQAVNTDLVGLNALQIMDKIITAAGAAGLKVILDNHRSEAGNSNEANGLWYTSQFPTSNWMNDWVTLATRYKSFTDANGNPIVIGMDLRNEPHVLANGARTGACWTGDTETGGCPTTNTAQNWPVAATAAGNAILAVNPNLLIFVEGNDCYGTSCGWQGGNLEGVATNPITLNVPNQLVYSAHDYGPNLFQQPWFNSSTTFASLGAIWTQFWFYVSQNNIAPVWVGEFGDDNNASDLESATPGSEGQWFSSLVSFLGNWPNLSWTYWAANGEDSFALLANQYDGIASAQKQSMLATIQFPLSLGGTPDFTLSASPASLSIPQNANGSSTITVTPTGGFSGRVTLSISGLPTGVTASLGANPTTTGTILTFVTQGNAATGPATVTITGTSGSETHTTTIDLIIGSVNPNFSLSASPASLSITQGSSGSSMISVILTPSSGFNGTVTLSASGLPAGVTGTFSPPSITAPTPSTLTLTASNAAATGPATLTITGTSGSETHTVDIALTVNPITPDFSLTVNPTSLTIFAPPDGVCGGTTVTVTPTNGFTGAVGLTIPNLPAGINATFGPASTTSTSTLTVCASGNATPGTSTVTIAGTSGSLTHTTPLTLTVNANTTFSLSASPSTLSINQGASGTSTITVTPAGGSTGTVALSSSGLPTGVTATFSPPSTTGTSMLTLSASSTAATGATTVLVTGVSGSSTRTVTIALTVNPINPVATITPVINANSPYYIEEDLSVSNTTPITALSITITTQRTAGVGLNGEYNTVGGSVTQTDSVAPSTITYTFTLNPGQTLNAGSYLFAAQMSGTGTAHPTSGDVFSVTYTSGGTTASQTGHF